MDPHPEMAAMLAQLADPLRLSLLFELAGGPLPAGALAEATGAPVAEVAPQLGALVEAGVVERDGAAYRLADPALAEACAALRSVIVCRVATARRLDELPGGRGRR